MKINSIKFKICVLYVGILGLILISYRGLLYYNLYQTLYRDSDKQLIAKVREVHKTLRIFTVPFAESKRAVIFGARKIMGVNVNFPDEEKMKKSVAGWENRRMLLGLNRDYINFLDENGKTVVSSPNVDRGLAKFLEGYVSKKPGKKSFYNIVYKESLNLRIIVLPVNFGKLGRYTIQVGISTDPIIYILRERINKSAMSIPLILLLAVIISYFFVGQILKPVKQLTKIANDISRGNLTARVKVENVDAEMKYLAESFNDMLSRLEKAFTYAGEFSSYIAHELRTPLTIIKGETEVALKTVRSFEECTSVMESNLQEVDKILEIIDHLLLLSDINFRKEAVGVEPLDILEFINDIKEKAVLLAVQKDISMKFDVPQDKIMIMANEMELRRLLLNLIDNAIKFTPLKGTIDLSVKCENKKVFIAIRDSGVGINSEEISKIFNKSYRSAQAEGNAKTGSGLGLAIAQSIARMHQGHIEVKSVPMQGAVFTVILPIL
ncbi:MAG: HAMP domain-containing protein [PVC group bacterium]|nr:HAMP domain-containing protein [PVC group bacterium]